MAAALHKIGMDPEQQLYKPEIEDIATAWSEEENLAQQDNGRPHTANISRSFLQNVDILPWPACSPRDHATDSFEKDYRERVEKSKLLDKKPSYARSNHQQVQKKDFSDRHKKLPGLCQAPDPRFVPEQQQ
ncbi:MAP4K1 [Cordylochernes scorpioides]|uniref:MAP4K1 n=1 Tax=Cordylochernes scorpioides TaxID=51811 RepID=A0ABY6LJS1_9ARAC|nr:MAP4K1 [Cordylochernes scorpioides]